MDISALAVLGRFFMKWFLALFVAVLASSAEAACTDSYYNSYRAARISTIISGAPAGAAYVVGDSMLERGSVSFQQGTLSAGGKATYLLGSAGATVTTLADCFPWSSLNSPSVIVIQVGLNDAHNGTCCTGSGAGTSAGPFANALDAFLSSIRALHPGATIVLISEMPPESAAGIDTYRVFQTARAVYYLANNIIGTQGATFAFVDNYYALRGAACTPSSSAYVTPCYQAAGETLDNVHPGYSNTQAMIANILAAF
jgi:lysophospholipase L1-like esterase